ncbi:hypothetical protein Srufu_042100 [Streptomyces libani subsp. rufus]|nr:hypothetical protein Srufu_042100 [Streptomyces libani subsp. rufus]
MAHQKRDGKSVRRMQCPEGPDRLRSGPSGVSGVLGGAQVRLGGTRLGPSGRGAAAPVSVRASFAARALPPPRPVP